MRNILCVLVNTMMYYVRFVYATKIRLREILTSEIFYRQKYPDLQYITVQYKADIKHSIF